MRVGILGSGQLGRMLALAGHSLGIRTVVFAQNASDPACAVTEYELGSWSDRDALDRFASRIDVATFEFENVSPEAAERIAARVPVRPSLRALDVSADRWSEKSLFRQLGVSTAEFRKVDSQTDLESAVVELGMPAILKTRRMGYDGKGQRVVRDEVDVRTAWTDLGSVPCILEARVPFEREVSILGARAADGTMQTFPLSENRHRDGVLELSLAPANIDAQLAGRAREYLERIALHFDYVGVLALELFVVGTALLANEMAPRVHNTAHWTLEGARTSQFENHLRAITGLPLGRAEARGHSAMRNLLGSVPSSAAILSVPDAHLHDYGKVPRAGRKVGHVTISCEDVSERDARLTELELVLRKQSREAAGIE